MKRNWNEHTTLKVLLEEREDLLDKVEAIRDHAEQERREFTAEEDRQLSAILNDDTGEIAALDPLLVKKHEEVEAMKARAHILSQSRSPEEHARRCNGIIDPPSNTVPRVQHRMARLKAFPNTPEGAKDAYSCGMWLKTINAISRNQQPDEKAVRHLEAIGWHPQSPQAAQTESTDTSGGFLTPQPLSDAIISVRERVGVARRVCDIISMGSNSQDIPKRTAGLSVFLPGEGNTTTTSDMTFGRVNLVAVKRAVANQITNELSDDSLINMADRVIDEMSYALANQEDEDFINGDGTSTYAGEQGVLDALGSAGLFTAPVGQSTWLLLNNDSISQWKATLPAQYHETDKLSIICSSPFYYTVFDRLMNAAGGNSNSLLRTGGLFDLTDLQYNGIPIFISDKMPSTTAVSQNSALFGNFSASCMLGNRGSVRIGVSSEYAFLDDVQTLLAVSRYDFNVHAGGDSSTAGGFVGLATAAS